MNVKIIIPALFTCIFSFILLSKSVLSCNVPVFRYALERWPADPYEIVVFHRKPFSEIDKSNVEWLEKSSFANFQNANYSIQIVDLTSELSDSMRDLYESIDSHELPCMTVRYPMSAGISRVIWAGSLTKDNAVMAVDSPLRQEIAERIINGESVVWILLESGNTTKDNAAAELLQEQLSSMEKNLSLNYMSDGTVDKLTSEPDIRIVFSLLRLSRNDPAESIFINMLMHSEPDLFDYTSYPMTFPIYGRGRALFTLVGDGISERNIKEACAFLTGACSCEVKALNPGIDLLIAADWGTRLGESWIEYMELPTLVGVSQFITSAADNDSSVSTEMAAIDSDSTSSDIEMETIRTGSTQNSEENVQEISDTSMISDTPVKKTSTNVHGNIYLTLGIIITVIFSLRLFAVMNKKKEK